MKKTNNNNKTVCAETVLIEEKDANNTAQLYDIKYSLHKHNGNFGIQ